MYRWAMFHELVSCGVEMKARRKKLMSTLQRVVQDVYPKGAVVAEVADGNGSPVCNACKRV